MNGDPREQALHAAAFLDLALDPAHLDGIAANLDLLHRHASRMMALELPPGTEPAPVFTP